MMENVELDRIPNPSDDHFAQALPSMANDKDAEAASHIKQGVAELQKEGKR